MSPDEPFMQREERDPQSWNLYGTLQWNAKKQEQGRPWEHEDSDSERAPVPIAKGAEAPSSSLSAVAGVGSTFANPHSSGFQVSDILAWPGGGLNHDIDTTILEDGTRVDRYACSRKRIWG